MNTIVEEVGITDQVFTPEQLPPPSTADELKDPSVKDQQTWSVDDIDNRASRTTSVLKEVFEHTTPYRRWGLNE